MTSIGVGHPDWQEYANWRGDWLYNPFLPVPNGGQDVGDFVTTNWASLHVFMFPNADTTFEIEWYADTAKTEDIATDFIDCPAGATIDVQLPVRGQLGDVFIANSTGADTTVFLAIQPSNLAVNRRTYITTPQVIGQKNFSVPHSSTQLIIADTIMSGPAFFSCQPHDTAAQVTIDLFGQNTTNGLEWHVDGFGKPAANMRQQVVMPESQAVIRLINADAAAAHIFDLMLVMESQ